jgi:hypothetical protein
MRRRSKEQPISLVAADRHGEQQEMHRRSELDTMLAIERRIG